MNDTNQSTGNVTAINIYGAVNANSSHCGVSNPAVIASKGIKRAVYALYFFVLILFGWVAYICYCDLQFDANNMAGVVVSVLGAIVTLLVGWQIYSLIRLEDIRHSYNEINIRFLELRQELDRRSLLLNAESSMLHGANYITWVNNGADISALGTAYTLLCHALKNYAIAFDKESAGKCIGMMRDCLFRAHEKNAWDKIFDEEVIDRIEADYKVLHNLHSCLNQSDAILLLRVRDSRSNKRLSQELLKEKAAQK